MILKNLRQNLISTFTNSATPQLDADCILEHFLECDRTFLLANRELEISPEVEAEIFGAAEKRAVGLPIAYITGHKEFFGYDFFVSPDVLIPKPDTEILVEQAISAVAELSTRASARSFERALEATKALTSRPFENLRDRDDVLKICDMCAGSGCVGISLALELEKAGVAFQSLTFVDISDAALNVAKKNIDALVSERLQKSIQLVKSDLFEEWGRYGGDAPVEGVGRNEVRPQGETSPLKFSLIVTNPPYIPTSEAKELLKDGRSEPILALDGGGDDGLSLIRRLVPQSAEHLEPNGVLLMETGEYNAKDAAEIFRDCGFSDVEIVKDLAGQLRVVKGTLHRTF